MLSALRQNSVLKILAEPNLVAMNGHQARFLAGGEFPVPVPQSGAGGGPATITVQYKKFGVQLDFVPYILDDDVIRLSVDPEVSSVDFTLGIELSGTKVPGLNTRNAHTVVELHEGQTLAMAGLMQLSLTNQAIRIPGLGDLPYIGPFFSNNTANRVEKELVVLVTPYLVEAMHPDEVPPRPGDEVNEPNDLEFYLLGRIQGRTGDAAFRSTTNIDDPLDCVRRMKLESRCIQGPNGYSN
jgi:pilus assembly protein CpaC